MPFWYSRAFSLPQFWPYVDFGAYLFSLSISEFGYRMLKVSLCNPRVSLLPHCSCLRRYLTALPGSVALRACSRGTAERSVFTDLCLLTGSPPPWDARLPQKLWRLPDTVCSGCCLTPLCTENFCLHRQCSPALLSGLLLVHLSL